MSEKSRRFSKNIKGVAAVEVAILLPVLLLASLGAINFGYMIFVKHSMEATAQEIARLKAYGGVSNRDARQLALQRLRTVNGKFQVNFKNSTADQTSVKIKTKTKDAILVEIPFFDMSKLSKNIEVEYIVPNI